MWAFTRLSLAAAVLAPALSTYAARILVQVGPGGQTIFSPSNVTASVGDVVSFQFLSKNHSVTQSSFASPCEPLAGGVDSGFQPVAVDATKLPEFSIAINNASKPLFFFSAQTALVDECNLGMVFSINQDANSATKSFADFQANAKADVPAAKATAVASSSTVAAAPAAASSAAKILVQVGAGNGLTFSPSNISANTGDTVSFQFLNGNHSVTQSSFASPCEPLAGGIDSGLQFVAANATAVPEFSFTITNGSKQFFFFSKQTVPANECNKGMVFSINQDPTSAVKSFAAFQANAKADIPASTATAVGTKATAVPAKASSGSEILVQVGADDSLTFSPSNISAKAGDTVTFQFLSKNHSVTQTSFAKPCSSPLVGGVDSGFQPIAPNATAIPQFSFTVNNANTPLFFFSKQGAECNKGMVFSINQDPNSAKSFAAFQANAEADIPASTATAVGTASKATAVPAKASTGSEILVQVGADDSLTFSPSNISAKAGDTVTFQFLSKNHSVTQTTFAEPCSSPLFGGIDSGFQPIAPNATAIPQFSFTLNNANTPLFFFSKQGAECNQGMVFSINQDPNSAKSFAAFQANAEVDIRLAAKVNKTGRRVHARDFTKVVGR